MHLLKTVLFTLLVSGAYQAQAAILSFELDESSESRAIVHLVLDTEQEYINAIEGSVIFDTTLLTLTSISDGGSQINLWIDNPKERVPGVISFGGVTPHGFSGEKEKILTLQFEAKGSSKGMVFIKDAQVLINDGLGTPASLVTKDVEISSTGKAQGGSDVDKMKDTELPEKFDPYVILDADSFNGKQVLIFATQDKLSGIKKYQVREGRLAFYGDAESPYLLRHQALDRDIFVKAIDYSGNERIIMLSAQNPRKWYEQYELFAILGGIALVFFTLMRVRTWIASRRTS